MGTFEGFHPAQSIRWARTFAGLPGDFWRNDKMPYDFKSMICLFRPEDF